MKLKKIVHYCSSYYDIDNLTNIIPENIKVDKKS